MKECNMPKISVILPAYNAEKYIKEAIDSVLLQTYRDFELIILNDCSKDNTEQIIRSYEDDRIVYLKNQVNMGVAATLNRGLAAATGEYIARMDADDVSLPRRFEMQAAYLDTHPDVAVLGTALERFGEGIPTQIRRFSQNSAQMKADMLFACGLAHPSVMMRRQVILGLGGYDLEFEGMEDYELWCRVSQEHQVAALDEVLLRYRIHPQQVTKNPSEKYIRRMKRLKAMQLEQIGLRPEGEIADCFYDFCLGKRPQEQEQIFRLGRMLEQIAVANEKTGYYNKDILRDNLSSILLGYASKLPRKKAGELWKSSTLVTRRQVIWRRIKERVKQLLKRSQGENR